MAFIGFLLLSKDAIFVLSHFFLTTSDSHGTLHLAFSLVGIYSSCYCYIGSNKAFIFVTWNISFRRLLRCIKLIYYSYCILILLLVSEDQSYHEALTVCTLLLHRQILANTILWSEVKEDVSHRKKRVFCNWTHGINFKCSCCVLFFLTEGGQPSFYTENNSSLSFFLWIPFLPSTIFFSSPTSKLVSCRVSPRLKTPPPLRAFRQDLNNHSKMPHPFFFWFSAEAC